MPTPRFAIWTFSLAMMALATGVASAQNYPTRPVRIVTSEPGSTNDLVARLIAQGLTVSLGRQVIVDNRAIRAGEVVAGAQPDGYTLLSYGTPLWIMPFLRDNVPWDPVRDFSPVTWATSSPNILVVHPSVRVNSVSELIGMAKARPGELNYATSSPGSAAHLAGELFRVMAAVKIVRIAYKGTGTALNGIVGGEVQLMFSTAAAAAPHIKSGRLRALAVTSAQPTSLVPGLPTVAASGLPGYEAILILGIFAPAGTPAALLTRLNEEVVRTLNTAEVKERLHKVGVEVVGSSPAQFAAKIRSEMARWSKVIKDAGIRDE